MRTASQIKQLAEVDIKKISDEKLLVTGELNFNTVPDLCQLISTIAIAEHCTIDLSKVEYSDSAGLALLVNWLRQAKSQQKNIEFINPPHQMQAIAKICGISKILCF